MTQLPPDTGSGDIPWGDNVLPGRQWHTLDQLWVYVAPRDQEFVLSHCYAEPGIRGRYQFGQLTEVRYPFSADLTLSQKLSPRAIVARPIESIHLPARASIKLYVGTSLWLCLLRGDDVLLDIPVARLSDTWFGPDTMRGETCYACQTHARLSMAGVTANPYKAITPITISNETTKALTLDRINLPVHHLSLYQQNSSANQQRYWTSAISMTNLDNSPDIEIKVSHDAPEECVDAALLTTARNPLVTGRLRRTLSYLLG